MPSRCRPNRLVEGRCDGWGAFPTRCRARGIFAQSRNSFAPLDRAMIATGSGWRPGKVDCDGLRGSNIKRKKQKQAEVARTHAMPRSEDRLRRNSWLEAGAALRLPMILPASIARSGHRSRALE